MLYFRRATVGAGIQFFAMHAVMVFAATDKANLRGSGQGHFVRQGFYRHCSLLFRFIILYYPFAPYAFTRQATVFASWRFGAGFGYKVWPYYEMALYALRF